MWKELLKTALELIGEFFLNKTMENRVKHDVVDESTILHQQIAALKN